MHLLIFLPFIVAGPNYVCNYNCVGGCQLCIRLYEVSLYYGYSVTKGSKDEMLDLNLSNVTFVAGVYMQSHPAEPFNILETYAFSLKIPVSSYCTYVVGQHIRYM